MSTNFSSGLESKGVPVESFSQIGKVWSTDTWFVNAGTGSDSNQGVREAPFATISQAITTAVAGDIVLKAEYVH